MGTLVDDDGETFTFSKEPSQLEFYKCFHDPSRKKGKFIDGSELLRIRAEGEEQGEKSEITDEKVGLWYYFYRPYYTSRKIGSKQKESIKEINKSIALNQADASKNNMYLGASLLLWLALLLWVWDTSLSVVLMFIPSVFCFHFFYEASIAKEKVSKLESDVQALEREVDELRRQKEVIDKRIRTLDVMDSFWRKIKQNEQFYLNTFSDEDQAVIEENSKDYYGAMEGKIEFKKGARPNFPVIPSWAMLQASRPVGSSSWHQYSGLDIVAERIKKKVATWRVYKTGDPVFRLWSIQFIFFLEKHMSIISFCYDFIEDRIYSQNVEAFQYNHITNYSFVDEDISFMEKGDFSVKLPGKFKENIFGKEVKTISFSAASGASYRCVIPDEDVNKGLKKWLGVLMEQEVGCGESDLGNEDTDLYDDLSREHDDLRKERFLTGLGDEGSEGLIETLALLSFKQIGLKVAEFSIREGNSNETVEQRGSSYDQ